MTMVLFVSLLLAFCWQIPPLRVFIIVCALFFLLCFLLTLTEKDKYTYKIKKDSNWSKIMEEYAKKRRRLEIYNEDYAFHRWQENQFSYYAPLYKEKMDNPPKTKVIVQLKDKSAPIYLSDEMTCNERLNELHLRYSGRGADKRKSTQQPITAGSVSCCLRPKRGAQMCRLSDLQSCRLRGRRHAALRNVAPHCILEAPVWTFTRAVTQSS